MVALFVGIVAVLGIVLFATGEPPSTEEGEGWPWPIKRLTDFGRAVEGWAAGLQLAALAFQVPFGVGQAPPPVRVGLGGGHGGGYACGRRGAVYSRAVSGIRGASPLGIEPRRILQDSCFQNCPLESGDGTRDSSRTRNRV